MSKSKGKQTRKIKYQGRSKRTEVRFTPGSFSSPTFVVVTLTSCITIKLLLVQHDFYQSLLLLLCLLMGSHFSNTCMLITFVLLFHMLFSLGSVSNTIYQSRLKSWCSLILSIHRLSGTHSQKNE